MFFLFLFLEGSLLAVLTSIYLLFYHGTAVILKHAELKQRSLLLEMQASQYRSVQEHMRQTAKLRHDFRHSILLLTSLAEKGDLSAIRTHLAGYGSILKEDMPINYCSNAAMNALLCSYHEKAVSAGINTDWHIELPEPLPVTELDMVSLLGNMMENAIDGNTRKGKDGYRSTKHSGKGIGLSAIINSPSAPQPLRRG